MNNKVLENFGFKQMLFLILFLCNTLISNALSFPIIHYSLLTFPYLHDFHTSIAEVNFNEKNKSLEVSLRVFTDDLELTLSKINNIKEFHLDKTKKYNDLIHKYIENNFCFTDAKNQKVPSTWVGKELESDVTWIYFEIPLKKSLKGFQLKNAVLTELYEDQSNLVNAFYKKQKRTYIYRRSELTHKLDFEIQ